jgi:carboxymethylenebutenolidase
MMKHAITRVALATFALAALILSFSATASAQEWSQPWARDQISKSPRHSEWAQVKHDARTVDTLIVYPETREKRPVVIVIHEIFGLSDWGSSSLTKLPPPVTSQWRPICSAAWARMADAPTP